MEIQELTVAEAKRRVSTTGAEVASDAKVCVSLSNKGNHRKAWRKLPRCRLTGGIQL